jgi:hypothetical protein
LRSRKQQPLLRRPILRLLPQPPPLPPLLQVGSSFDLSSHSRLNSVMCASAQRLPLSLLLSSASESSPNAPVVR